jgi:hypothetical protein
MLRSWMRGGVVWHEMVLYGVVFCGLVKNSHVEMFRIESLSSNCTVVLSTWWPTDV